MSYTSALLLCFLGIPPLEFSGQAMMKFKEAAQVGCPHIDVLVDNPNEDPVSTARCVSEEASRLGLCLEASDTKKKRWPAVPSGPGGNS